MGRTRRVAVDQDTDWQFHETFSDDQGTTLPPEQDYVILSQETAVGAVPIYHTRTAAYTDITVWAEGLITFGTPTAAQVSFMANLGTDTDLADFPGDYIAVGFPDGTAFDMTIGLKPGYLVVDWDGAEAIVTPTGITIAGAFSGTQSSWRLGGQTFVNSSGNYQGFLLSDLFHTDLSAGNDTFTTPSPAAETIRGLAGDDIINGQGGGDWLEGNDGNDQLNGGADTDRLFGGDGDDVLDGGTGGDIIDGGAGTDRIVIDESYWGYSLDRRSLASGGDLEGDEWTNIEAYELRGGSGMDWLTGTSGDDRLYGGNGYDTLSGGGGNDILDAGGGSIGYTTALKGDLISGTTDVTDLFQWYNQGNREAAVSIDDTISSFIFSTQRVLSFDVTGDGALFFVRDTFPGVANVSHTYTLRDQFGNTIDLFADGVELTAGRYSLEIDVEDDRGFGAAIDYNVSLHLQNFDPTAYYTDGNGDFAGYVYDYDGDGQVTPGVTPIANNRLSGGTGDDTFYVHSASDQVSEFAGEGTDTVVSDVDWSLGPNLENLTLTGRATRGAGNALGNVIIGDGVNNLLTGNNGNDTIDGGAGNDRIDGGAGIDTASYASATAAVTVRLTVADAQNTGGAGTDTLVSIENLTGSDYFDVLVGNSGNNVLHGGLGNDTLVGGLGDDIFYGEGGLDSASYASASAAVMIDLRIVGPQQTGSAGADTFIGVEAVIGTAYNDVLIGNSFNNRLTGGAGNDTINGGGGGSDTAGYLNAPSAVTVNLAITVAQNTIGAGIDTLIGIARILGSNYNDTLTGDKVGNVLYGGDGDDLLTGAGGNDQLFGGAGIDTAGYVAAPSAVTVTLATSQAQVTGGAGTDMITGVENLAGSAFNDTLTGNNGANLLSGNGGNDMLNGGLGMDVLTGGAGQDQFLFTTTVSSGNIDRISDFVAIDDTIVLSHTIFAGLATGALAAGAYNTGSAATQSDDRIIYNSATGALLFDRDGVGGVIGHQFATIGTGLTLSAADFMVS